MSASAELARRRGVRSSLREWSRLNNFEPAPHHLLLIRQAREGGAR